MVTLLIATGLMASEMVCESVTVPDTLVAATRMSLLPAMAQEKLAELAPLAPIRRGTATSKKQVPDSPARAQKKRAKAVTLKTEKNGRDPRLPAPGKALVREFDGKKHTVKVHADGFEYRGKTYRSLSAVAKVISGCIWNGYGFFGLLEKK